MRAPGGKLSRGAYGERDSLQSRLFYAAIEEGQALSLGTFGHRTIRMARDRSATRLALPLRLFKPISI
jgi:hypothetical protein